MSGKTDTLGVGPPPEQLAQIWGVSRKELSQKLSYIIIAGFSGLCTALFCPDLVM